MNGYSPTRTSTSRPSPVRPESAPTLHIDNLTARFGGVTALNGLTATVQAGEAIGVVGPNGAGKTTFLNAISGLLGRAVSGEIELFGRSIVRESPVRIAKRGVARSFQHPPLLDTATVLENVVVGSHHAEGFAAARQIFTPWRVRQTERAEHVRARALLARAGLSSLQHREAGSLPYGARKQVDILRAIFHRPALLLLDEPTSGLDIGEQRKVVDIIQDLRADPSVSILLVEHHMDVVRQCASRVLGVQAGRVIATGTPDEVFESPEYREAVVGRSHQRSGAQVGPLERRD
ncbi:ABC transporter ATP-binding protein [Amycolatopsis pithecellobii]|uniref:ATP-binding cassette domain-containing protein n=1 Tax=Amycolatopsis pithecellobii TaxID=664692 RepID=A0A6N7YR01_9PSEU|nr:ATP-binding cassette domain-containing protein [Amycolatopsis pithecellobii]MTD55447.1 ATP-binding cassette domain-containing protein [Amycolatopsis pithecellobii]